MMVSEAPVGLWMAAPLPARETREFIVPSASTRWQDAPLAVSIASFVAAVASALNTHTRQRDMGLMPGGDENACAHGVHMNAGDGGDAWIFRSYNCLVTCLQGKVLVGVHR